METSNYGKTTGTMIMLKIISQSNSGKSSTILKVYLYIQIYIYIIDCIFRGHKMIFAGENSRFSK